MDGVRAGGFNSYVGGTFLSWDPPVNYLTL